MLDIDPDGFDPFEALCARNGVPYWCPETWTARTGRRGAHVYFRHPGPSVPIRTTAGVVAPGIDVRADGGYVILPPALHATGRRYEWLDGFSPGQVELMTPPDWLLRALTPPQRPAPAVSAKPFDAVPDARLEEGRRNVSMASLAGSMRRRGFSAAAIAAALAAENADRCHPPLPDDEIRRIAQSIARYPTAPGPGLLPAHGEHTLNVAGVELPVRSRAGRRD